MISTSEAAGIRLADRAFPANGQRKGPAWLQDARAAAARHFAEVGLPTTRDEEWRFTSLRGLGEVAFAPVPPVGSGPTVDPDAHALPGLSGPRLVFVNGRFDPRVSSIGELPAGVTIRPLAEALEADDPILREHLTAQASAEDALTALNTATFADGAVVHVGPGVQMTMPVRVLSIIDTSEPLMTSPRHLVVAEKGSDVTVVEDAVSRAEGVHFTNSVTEVFVGPNAGVKHYFLDRAGEQSYSVSSLQTRQGRDSRFASHSVLLGGAVVRNDVHPVLDGEGCTSLLNGLYIGRGTQHLDNHMRVEHAKPHCDSRQYYTGILGDQAHGVFSGRIVVAQDAQKTDAIQSNQNLLLSPRAQANTKPQLEIYADDVRCTHGATVGELDADAVFYLRTRGMSEDAARALLTYAFASESLDRMDLVPVREEIRRLVLQRLPQSAFIEETV